MHTIKFAAIAMAAASAFTVPSAAYAGEKKVPATEIVLPAPTEELGQVVFYRPPGMGSAIACSIHENGEKISSLAGARYFVLNTTPGRHEYTVKTEASDSLALEVEPGERQWVACKIKMGFMVGRPDIRPSNEEEFRAVKKISLVDDDDMGPAPGAMRSTDIEAALGGGAVAEPASE